MSKFPYPTCAEFVAMTADEFAQFWETFQKLDLIKTAPFAGRWYLGEHDIPDMITLKRAGWKPAFTLTMSQPMSWFWRRPLRPGTRDKKGQMFTSTSAAMSELRREESRGSGQVTQWKIMINVGGEMHPASVPARGPLEAGLFARNLCGYVVEKSREPNAHAV